LRVQENPADIGRCGCGRREYCDGSHGLSEAQWQELRAKELAEDAAWNQAAGKTAAEQR
jgi:hypothetical protein